MNNSVAMYKNQPINNLLYDLKRKNPINDVPLFNIIRQTVLTKLHLYVHNWKQPKFNLAVINTA